MLRDTRAVTEAAAAMLYVPREELEKLQRQTEQTKRQKVAASEALKKEAAALKRAEAEAQQLRAQLDAIQDAAGRQVDEMEAARKRDLEDLEQRHQVDLASLSEAILKANLELERLRDRCATVRGRTSELEQQITKQSAMIAELSSRRDNNMGATRLLNLERRRVEELKRLNQELRATITANWSKETLELAEEAERIPRLEAEMAVLKKTLKDLETEVIELKHIIYPPPPMEGGAFNRSLRFMVMKLIAIANVCHSHL